MTPEEFRRFGHAMIDSDRRLSGQSRSAAGDGAGEARRDPKECCPRTRLRPGSRWSDIFADFDRIVMPGVSHFQHPRFFGYFPANSLLSGVIADLASTGLGVVGLSWQSGPALTEIEEVTCDWVRQMVGLSDAWSGVIQDTASTSTLVALITARERATNYAIGERRTAERDARSSRSTRRRTATAR